MECGPQLGEQQQQGKMSEEQRRALAVVDIGLKLLDALPAPQLNHANGE